MSRFFSFMKKKGDKDGEMPVSPPPSPLAKSKSESEGKSVKQVKKRSNKRERRKRPAAASEEGSSLETEPCELISTDANGNSMTGKVRSSSNANAGEMVLRITAAEGDCDSLGDVDSISEEEIVNGKMSHSSLIPHVQTQAVEASSEKPPDDLLENASQDAETKVKEINDLPQIKVEKVSCSGTNDTVDDLMDDFMNEAFDDLETDIPSKDSPHVSEEETKTDNNVAGLNGGGPATVLNETPPQEENTEKGDICSKKDNFDDHSVLVRPLSTDTAVTHYSSCEPGSDVFDSASEEFHDALQHGPVLTDEEKVPFQNAALRESGSLSPEDFGEVIFRKVKQNAASNESYDGDDVNKTKENNVSRTGDENLGICFEVASQGRASFLVEDIIEARNQICQEPPPVSVRTGSPASKRDPSIDLDKHDGELIDNLDRDIPSSKLKNSDSDLSFSGSVDPVTPIKDDENSTLSLIEDCPSGGNAMQPMECAVLGADPSFAYDKEDLTCRPVVSEQVNKPSVDEPVSSHTDLCSNSETSGKDNEVTGEQVDGVNIEASKKVILSPEKCENEADKVLNSVNFPSAAESTISDEPIKIDSNVTENDTYSTCVKQASLGDTARLATNDEVSSSSVDNQKGCSGSEDIATTRKFSLCSNSGGSSSISCTEVGSTETSARDHKTDNARSSSGVSDDTSLRSSSRSSFKKQMSLEEELSKYDDQEIKKEAEARLAQRRAARAEARELRLRELEKQQQQNPENNDDASDMSVGEEHAKFLVDRSTTSMQKHERSMKEDDFGCFFESDGQNGDVFFTDLSDQSQLANAGDYALPSSENVSSHSKRTSELVCHQNASAADSLLLSNAQNITENIDSEPQNYFGIVDTEVLHEPNSITNDQKTIRESFIPAAHDSLLGSSCDSRNDRNNKNYLGSTLANPRNSFHLNTENRVKASQAPRRNSDGLINLGGFDMMSSKKSMHSFPDGNAMSNSNSLVRRATWSPSKDGSSVTGVLACNASKAFSSQASRRKNWRLLEPIPGVDDVCSKHKRFSYGSSPTSSVRSQALSAVNVSSRQEATETILSNTDGGSGGRSNNSRAATTTATANNGHHHTAGIVPPPPPMPHYTRHSSEESNPDDPAASKDIRELEEKFRGAMISNAQLDNEKSQLTYQVELLKDFRADITEQLTQLKKEHKKKCSEHEQLRKVYAKLQEESRKVRRVLEQRDELIQEYGLVVVGGSTEDEDDEDDDDESDLAAREETEEGLVLPRPVPMKRVLLSQEAAEILEKGAAKGSLEWRLRRVVEHKRELEDELRRVNLELEEQVNNQRQSNCLDSNIQKEANKTVNEYKFKVQRAEAEVSSLQANVNRLEVLVTRYKTQVEELEKSEEELKLEKRKLQRELRDAQGRLEELETTNSHLLRRFEKLKNARSNLLKDLSQDPV